MMKPDRLVFGLLNTASRVGDAAAAEKLRSFTISWSRYGYHGLIIEGREVDEILRRALELGYEFCLIQAYGHVISEHWHPKNSGRRDFLGELDDWMNSRRFLVTGHILKDAGGWFGLEDHCLLVNLAHYRALGQPAFSADAQGPRTLPRPAGDAGSSAPLRLEPSGESETATPRLPGWSFIAESLRHNLTVYNFDEPLSGQKLFLSRGAGRETEAFNLLLKQNALILDAGRATDALPRDYQIFLDAIALQTRNVKRGVFIWNIEPYSDVAEPPVDFPRPLRRLYSVAAGFKPNMILHTHGFDERTKVVFFDYSANALRVKKLLRDEWDGEDYPRFVRYVFKKFPHPETFYHLWDGRTPDNVRADEMDAFWRDEIEKWGGEQVIREHWQRYRTLEHEYLQCDILTEQERLLARIDDEPASVIWWSNAFFTVYSNWFYTIDERRALYHRWIEGLAAKNPNIFPYGSDYNNISVNHTRAHDYASEFSRHGENYLNPAGTHKYEIRF